MRMWGVCADWLCDKHLLGEHAEMHMFVGCINKNKSLKGYIDGGLVVLSSLLHRHDVLAHEMERRGMKHHSPLPAYDAKKYASDGCISVPNNLKELLKRCDACKRKYKDDICSLVDAIEKYNSTK